MINRAALEQRVREWGLREDIVEKDYVLGWVLWGIGSDSRLNRTWVFKGGTCLKKCYIETYRFSEDLDFTIAAGGPLLPEDVEPIFQAILKGISERSGIDFSVRPPPVPYPAFWPLDRRKDLLSRPAQRALTGKHQT